MKEKYKYQPCNMLVTGGAGFIGANFIHYILVKDPGVSIVNLDLLTYAGNIANLDNIQDESRHHFVKGDVCDRNLIDRLLRDHKIDTIVHFAAESHVDRSINGPAVFVKTNFEGTSTLLEAARVYWQEEMKWSKEDCRFHQISTDEVYGSLDRETPAFTETTPYAPNSPYSASKAGADHLVRAYYHTFGLPVTISCCSNNYGPLQHQEKLVPTVIRSCINKQLIPIYGDGSNIRDWLFVIDHCSAVDSILRLGKVGELYNIGGNNEVANIDIVLHICRILDELVPHDLEGGYASLISFVTDRPGHDWRYAIAADKLKSATGWTPESNFKQMLSTTIQMYAELIPMGSTANMLNEIGMSRNGHASTSR